MNDPEFSKKMRSTAICFFITAGVVFVLSFMAAFVIQELLPPDSVGDLFGFIAYLGGPLPIVPGALIALGILALITSSAARGKRRSHGIPPAG